MVRSTSGFRSTRRGGFTLIELLVVIAIIAILIGLLVPAVQKVRAAAARTQCKNNLKQIALALHSFHDEYQKFPPGYVSQVAGDGSDLGPGWGWGTFLLPYLEQEATFRDIDLTLDIGNAANATPRARVISVFICPSDVGPSTFTATGTSTLVASSHYVGMYGTDEIEDNPDNGNGCFYRNSKIRIADILDGTSNTILVGERHSYLSNATWTGAVTGATVPPNHPSSLGAEDAPVLCLGHTGPASEGHTPNNATNHVDDFGSYHEQGANFIHADGSVHSISDAVDPVIWEALGTRAGREIISGIDF